MNAKRDDMQNDGHVKHLNVHLSLCELPSREIELSDGEVHIWFGILDLSASEICEFERILTKDELMRCGRLHFLEDRKRFIARYGTLRKILSYYLNVKPSELRFKQTENGKPEIAEPCGMSTIDFNVSHSQGAVLFAFAQNRKIGVDLEYVHTIPEMEYVVEQCFAENEKRIYRELPNDKKTDVFFQYWTLKESLLKGIGVGLTRPLDMLDVSSVGSNVKTLRISERDTGAAFHWSLRTLKLGRDYAGALAMQKI